MYRFALLTLPVLTLVPLVAGPAPNLTDDPPSFKADVQPLLTKYCVQCHGEMRPKAGIRFDSYDGMMKSKRKPLVVGQPDQSVMVKSMTGKGNKPMPPKRSPQPTKEEVDLLKAWIKAGAKDDSKGEE